jgi:stress-induced morphogen
MYTVEITSKAFEGLSVIKQHRMVNEVLAEDIRKMHGFQVSQASKH